MLSSSITVVFVSILALAAPFQGIAGSAKGIAKRTPHQSFVRCTDNALSGDTLVTPQSPDGCAYGCANRGGGYNYAFSYYQPSTNTCICGHNPPQAQNYISPCSSTKWSIYSLTTEFNHLGCRANISGTPSTSVIVPHLPWCFNHCASSNYMYFTPNLDGSFYCFCDNGNFGTGAASCAAAGVSSFGSGAGYYYSK